MKQIAAAGGVVLFGKKIRVDVAQLGYSHEDQCGCIAKLQATEFRESIKYPDCKDWLDVYLTRYLCAAGVENDLYVKLMLTKDCLLVTLHSLHTPEY